MSIRKSNRQGDILFCLTSKYSMKTHTRKAGSPHTCRSTLNIWLQIHNKVWRTDVVEVVGAAVEEPVSVPVVAGAERHGRAVPLVDDSEFIRTLGEVVVDDHKFISLCEA